MHSAGEAEGNQSFSFAVEHIENNNNGYDDQVGNLDSEGEDVIQDCKGHAETSDVVGCVIGG
jgi:hypothetical protein